MTSQLWDTVTLASRPWYLTTGIIVGVLNLLYILYARETTPLRRIPGPFLASITKLWVVQKQRSFKRPLVDIDLHKKYGPIVRIAPNEVLISSPQVFRTVYGAGSHFPKGEWYQGTGDGGASDSDELDFLSETNMEKYRIQRRAVGPAYTADAMKDYEVNIDSILKKDIAIMHQRAGKSIDVDLFMNCFASDCFSTATFSKCMNLVEAGEPNSSITAVHEAWKYMHIIGYFPQIHQAMLRINRFLETTSAISLVKKSLAIASSKVFLSDQATSNPFVYPVTQIMERFAQRDSTNAELYNEKPNDVLGKLFLLKKEKNTLKDHWVRNIALTNFGAGIETTAITVSAFMNNVVSHPGCQERIHQELDAAKKAGNLSDPPKLRQMKDHLPYLTACLSESMRLHPVVGMPLVRSVPEGQVLEGHFLPAGTTVGINPWVFARDKSLYGEDAEEWRPERWLEYSPEQLKHLETYNISFGSGARSCPGKHLAQAIYTKMIPMLLDHFEWSLTDPEAEKVLQCTFSIRYMKLMMQWKERKAN